MHSYLRWVPIGLLAGLVLGVGQSAMAQAPAPAPEEDALGEAPAAPEEAPPAEPEPEPAAAAQLSAAPAAPAPAPTPPPPAPTAVSSIPDGEAPPAPIPPQFPPAIPNIDYGARLRVATRFQNYDDPEKFNDISQQADADIYMGGQIHRMLKWQASVTISYAGTISQVQQTNVLPLDVIARFEPMPEFNIYMGRMIVVSDRYTPSGPWGMDEFYYPGVFPGAAQVALQKAGPQQRDLGINVWGAPLGGMIKYYLGVYQIHDPALNPLLSGRIQVSLLSGEPAFYQRTTYMGTKDLVSLGFGGQYQKAGSVGTAPPAMMGMPAPMAPTDDYSYFTGDLTVDKVLGAAGTVSLNAAYSRFQGDFQRWESFWLVGAGYLMPKPVGIGKIRFAVRYQRAAEANIEGLDDSSILDGQISYNVAAWFARFQLGYRRSEVVQRATATTQARLVPGNQIYLGITLADP